MAKSLKLLIIFNCCFGVCSIIWKNIWQPTFVKMVLYLQIINSQSRSGMTGQNMSCWYIETLLLQRLNNLLYTTFFLCTLRDNLCPRCRSKDTSFAKQVSQLTSLAHTNLNSKTQQPPLSRVRLHISYRVDNPKHHYRDVLFLWTVNLPNN